MNFGANMLSLPLHKQRLISLIDDDDPESQLESDSCQIERPPILHQQYQNANSYKCNHMYDRPKYLYTQIDKSLAASSSLTLPSSDYIEKSQKELQKRIETEIQKKFEKELYYGKTKNKVIEISDEESEQINNRESQNQENSYVIEVNRIQEELGNVNQNDQSQKQISEIGSEESSVIVIKRKKKSIKKRLKKFVNTSNKVKIQNKSNQNQQTQQCPICLVDLNKKEQKKKGRLPCKHIFCLKCILQASRFSNRCPYCRAQFNEIVSNGKKIQVQDSHLNEEFQDPQDEPCYVCGRNDDFAHLLECEFCQYAYCHTYCDPRLNRNQPPEEAWFCASCQDLLRNRQQNQEQQNEEVAEQDNQSQVNHENEISQISSDNRPFERKMEQKESEQRDEVIQVDRMEDEYNNIDL